MTVTTDPLKTGISALKYLGERTQATLPSAASWSGYTATLTDLGENGTYVHSNGTRWRVLNGTGSLKTLGAAVTGIANSETIVLQTLIPAGAWQTNDTIRIWFTTTKSGTTDTGNLTVRIGTAGTTADTAITGLNPISILAASGRSIGGIYDIKLAGATSALKVGSNGSGNGSYVGGTTAPAAATVITDASANNLYVSVSLASSSTNDTLTMQSGQIQLITP